MARIFKIGSPQIVEDEALRELAWCERRLPCDHLPRRRAGGPLSGLHRPAPCLG